MKSTPFSAACLPRYSAQVGQRLEQVERFFLFLDQFAVEPRGVRDVADQTVQTAHVMLDHIQQLVALILALGEAQGADGGAQAASGFLISCATSAANCSLASIRS